MRPKCAHCSNDDLDEMFLSEWVLSQRRIYGVKDGTLYASPESKEIFELAKGQHIFCNKCWSEFEMPEALELSFDDIEKEAI